MANSPRLCGSQRCSPPEAVVKEFGSPWPTSDARAPGSRFNPKLNLNHRSVIVFNSQMSNISHPSASFFYNSGHCSLARFMNEENCNECALLAAGVAGECAVIWRLFRFIISGGTSDDELVL